MAKHGWPVSSKDAPGARALLVVGIHREERAFGEAVAAELADAPIDVLVIPEGLSGRHPRQDQKFQFDTLHRALYQQLLPHVLGRYPLLIDLHSGLDADGPCVDLYSADPERWRTGLRAFGATFPDIGLRAIRLVARDGEAAGNDPADGDMPVAATVIPEEIWRNPAFAYVGVEIYLREPGNGDPALWAYTRRLLAVLAG